MPLTVTTKTFDVILKETRVNIKKWSAFVTAASDTQVMDADPVDLISTLTTTSPYVQNTAIIIMGIKELLASFKYLDSQKLTSANLRTLLDTYLINVDTMFGTAYDEVAWLAAVETTKMIQILIGNTVNLKQNN